MIYINITNFVLTINLKKHYKNSASVSQIKFESPKSLLLLKRFISLLLTTLNPRKPKVR